MPNQDKSGGDRWASRIGVILAVAGSAVGLGNFLRFPGNAAQNGAGAFMIPYFISLLILGIPLCWAEWTMGRYGGSKGFHSAPGIFASIWRNRFSKYLGAIALLIPLTIYMWYVLVEAWCLGYAISYLNGDLMMGSDSEGYNNFFGDFVGAGEDGALLGEGKRGWLLLLAGVFCINFALIYRGISKGIETLCKIAMPLMVLLALVVLVRVLTLGTPDPNIPEQSVSGGLGYMWNPDFEKLSDPQTWLAASGQIFFSLSVGFGIIVNYASYLRRNDDVVLSGLTSSSMNEFFEVCLGGLITIPAAFIFMGALGDNTLGSSMALGFKALPNVFASMWGGQFFGFLWFLMLFIAALTSSVSMLQPVIAFFEEGLGLKRHASSSILGLICALGTGFIVYFSKDLMALDTFDFWVGTATIPLLALIQALIYGWVFGIKRGQEEAHEGAHIRIPWFVQLMLKYVVPVYLLVIFVCFCWEKMPGKDEQQFATAQSAGQKLDQVEFTQAMRKNKIELPVELEYTQSNEHPGWELSKENGELLYVLKPDEEGNWQLLQNGSLLYAIKPNEDGNWAAFMHVPGYIEKIGSNRSALASVIFMLIIFVFLLMLIRIAGKRWEAEGRFNDL